MAHGILSHSRVDRLQHDSVAMEEIQARRAVKVIPGGRPLHDYVNLYIHARKKMLSKIRAQHASICVLRISTDVLDLPGVIVSDQNASSGYARFAAAPEGLRLIDEALVFAEYWTHPDDPIAEWRHGSIKCAEILVPDRCMTYRSGCGLSVFCPERSQTEGPIGREFMDSVEGLLGLEGGHSLLRRPSALMIPAHRMASNCSTSA
ncbi:MAG: DUF4433 domain-containing protein [Acidobacteria bacterium]|nr:DUF4433 domain-containing protein [Acidobacteriota bacterium]